MTTAIFIWDLRYTIDAKLLDFVRLTCNLEERTRMKLIINILIFFALTLGPSFVRASDNFAQIWDAVRQENVENVKTALAEDTNAVNEAAEKKFTLLFFASEHSSSNGIEILKMLLAGGAKVEARNILDQTPLFYAVASKNFEGAKILIAYGAKVNRQQDDGRTVLHWAATNGDSKMAELLISSGATINAQDYSGKTPLDFALEEKGRTKDPNLIKQYDETIAVLRHNPATR